jgi:hypothetical protein
LSLAVDHASVLQTHVPAAADHDVVEYLDAEEPNIRETAKSRLVGSLSLLYFPSR